MSGFHWSNKDYQCAVHNFPLLGCRFFPLFPHSSFLALTWHATGVSFQAWAKGSRLGYRVVAAMQTLFNVGIAKTGNPWKQLYPPRKTKCHEGG